MSRAGECNTPPNCPRLFETARGTVVFQGYDVAGTSGLARPPAGESQIEMPRETAFRLARQLLGQPERWPDVPSVLGGWQHELFRLEALQAYLVEGEGEKIAAFLDGRPNDAEEEPSDWVRYLTDCTRAGRRWQRVHVVDVPLTDYLRWELHTYPRLMALGYDTLIADRSRHPELAELTWDFYLGDPDQDDTFAVLMNYNSDGHPLGMWRTTDKPVVAECLRRRELALRYAEPLEEFVSRLEREPVPPR